MFINRDSNNKIIGLFACQQFDGQECLDESNMELQTFLNPLFTFDGKKTQKLTDNLQAANDAVNAVSITYNNGSFTAEDQSDLTTAAVQMIAGAITTKSWVTNGQVLSLTKDDIATIGSQLSAKIDAIWVAWNNYIAEINASTTIDGLNAINIDYTNL